MPVTRTGTSGRVRVFAGLRAQFDVEFERVEGRQFGGGAATHGLLGLAPGGVLVLGRLVRRGLPAVVQCCEHVPDRVVRLSQQVFVLRRQDASCLQPGGDLREYVRTVKDGRVTRADFAERVAERGGR